MKKIYILALLVCFSSFIFAQRQAINVAKFEIPSFINSLKTPTDTFAPYGIVHATAWNIYSVAANGVGGYVFGTNKYGDLAKAETFAVTTSYKIEEILIYVGAKQIVSGGNMVVSVNNCTGQGIAIVGADTATVYYAPSSQKASVSVSMYDVDTIGNYTVATFVEPVIVNADYAVVLDFSAMDDTLGIVSCHAGDPGTVQSAWEKESDGLWYTILAAWGINLDMVISVVVDQSTAGIDSHDFFEGMKFSAYPNPAVNSTRIQYEIAKQANVTMDIIDITGKVVMTMDEGNKTPGQHSLVVDTEKFSSGSYFVSMKTNGKRLTKRITINK